MRSKILFALFALVAILVTAGSALAQEAPAITSTPPTSAVAGTEYTYQVEHTAPDNGTVIYQLSVAPSGMTISTSGLITWTPTTSGTFEVTVSVSDDDSTDDQSYEILVTSVPGAFSAGDVNLGGEDQQRDENIVGYVWTISNSGSETISNIQLNVVGVNSEYEFIATLPSTTLAGGASMDVLVDAYVPEDQDAGQEKIGSVQLSGSGATSITRDITLEAENNLVIDKIEVKVEGSKDTLNSPGTIDDEAEYDDEIEIIVTVENTFDDNIEIRDVTVDLEADDLDPADGLDDDLGDIEDGKDEEATFSFFMDPDDIDADDEPFTITVIVEGEDENGALHGEEWDIELEMDVRSRDIRIVDINLVPNILSCEDDTLRIAYELRNVGTRDVDDAMIKFEIEEWNVGIWERDLSLDEGDTESYTAVLDLPSDFEEGTYFLDVTAYSSDDTDDDTDDDVYEVQVRCEGTSNQDDDGTTGSGIDVNQGNVPVEVTGVPVASSSGTKTSSIRDASTYLIVLGILVVVLIIIVIAMAAKLMRND